MRRTTIRWTAVVRLAAADVVHEWRITACLVLALAAVLAPLLVLFGLKSGIVTTMTERLVRDPRNLEVTLIGSYRLKPEWFQALRIDPAVGFLVPRTRSLASMMDMIGPKGRTIAAVEMVPTAPGDPLLADLPVPSGQGGVVLSYSAAKKLDVNAGDKITGQISRTLEGEFQAMRLPLDVAGVLPESVFGRDGIFVPIDLLVKTEDYRDGREDAPAPTELRVFTSARLFARDLDMVSSLADRIRADGIEVRTRAAEIETVKAVDKVLSFIFGVIAAIGIGGYALSLAASLWANVDRKRKDLALLRLVGFPVRAAMAFPTIQASLVGIAGVALSLAAYVVVAAMFNATLSSNLARDEFVCRLLPWHAAVAAAATMVIAWGASALGGYRASRIDPAESLREL